MYRINTLYKITKTSTYIQRLIALIAVAILSMVFLNATRSSAMTANISCGALFPTTPSITATGVGGWGGQNARVTYTPNITQGIAENYPDFYPITEAFLAGGGTFGINSLNPGVTYTLTLQLEDGTVLDTVNCTTPTNLPSVQMETILYSINGTVVNIDNNDVTNPTRIAAGSDIVFRTTMQNHGNGPLDVPGGTDFGVGTPGGGLDAFRLGIFGSTGGKAQFDRYISGDTNGNGDIDNDETCTVEVEYTNVTTAFNDADSNADGTDDIAELEASLTRLDGATFLFSHKDAGSEIVQVFNPIPPTGTLTCNAQTADSITIGYATTNPDAVETRIFNTTTNAAVGATFTDTAGVRVDNGLTADTTYSYEIQWNNAGVWTTVAGSTIDCMTDANEPTGTLTCNAQTVDSITITYATTNPINADLRIFNTTTNTAVGATFTDAAGTRTDTGLTSNTTYNYVLQWDDGGVWTTIAGSAIDCMTAPTPPTGTLTCNAQTFNSITVGYTATNPDGVDMRIFNTTTNTAVGATFVDAAGARADTGLTSNTTYNYVIQYDNLGTWTTVAGTGIDCTTLYPFGSIGDYLWYDIDENGVQGGAEDPLIGVSVKLLDGAGDPYLIDDPGAPGTQIPYVVMTSDGTDTYVDEKTGVTITLDAGEYIFQNLPGGDYIVMVDTATLPAGFLPTWDADNTTPIDGSQDHMSAVSLFGPGFPDVGNGLTAGDYTEVDDNFDQDFGYTFRVDLALTKTVEADGDGVYSASEVLPNPGAGANPDPSVFSYQITVENQSAVVTATGVDLTDVIPPGVTITGATPAIAGLPLTGAAGTGTPITWTVGTLAPSATQTYTLDAELSSANSAIFIAGFDFSNTDQNVAQVSAMNETDFDSTPNNAAPADYGGITTGFNPDPLVAEDDEDDARVTIVPALGNYVWHDQNNNGIQDAGEPGIVGVTVNLYDEAAPAVILATTVTGNDGSYFFGALDDTINYIVEFDNNSAALATFTPTQADQGADDTVDSDGDPTTGRTAAYDIGPGELYEDFDMGYVQKYSLGNRVFFDQNGNGIQDAGDAGIGGVTVELRDGNGDPFAVPVTTTTDGDGWYLFDCLLPGDYTVFIPDQATLTNYIGTGAGLDPDADTTDQDSHSVITAGGWISPPVTLENDGEPENELGGAGPQANTATDINSNLTVDFGFTLPDVALTKTTATAAAVFPGDDVSFTITLTNQGGVDLSNIDLVDYIPAGFILSPNDANGWAGGPGPGNVTNTYTGTIAVGASDTMSIVLRVDATNLPNGVNTTVLVNEAEVTEFDTPLDTRTSDIDSTGDTDATNDPGASSGTVNGAADNFIDGTGTNGAGAHDDGVAATDEDDHDPEDVTVQWGSIGDYVWIDTNNDGVQDAGEAPLPNITVKLLDAAGDPVLGTDGVTPVTAITDAVTGLYSFTFLPLGTYTVMIDTTTLPAGYLPTFDNDGNNDAANPNMPADHMSTVTITDVAPNNTAQDFGYLPQASLGNYVWIDTNNDGVQDADESPLPNITIKLLNPAGNPVLAADGVTEVTTTTDTDGLYTLTGLYPDGYQTMVDTTTLPLNYLQTYDLDGGTAGRDHMSGDVVVAAGDTNDTLDFGYIPAASLGDYVWIDANGNGQFDTGETPLENITVKLLDENGDPVLANNGVTEVTTTTDATGTYVFSGLYPGTYQTMIDTTTIPTGLIQSYDLDDGIGATNHMSGTVTLVAGENNLTLDYSYVVPASISGRVWFDVDNSKLQDNAEAGTPDVPVDLLNSSGSVLGVATTDTIGDYDFQNLIPGNYQVRITPPAGYLQTFDNDGADDYIIIDIALNSGEALSSFNFGLITPEELAATGSNYAWIGAGGIGTIILGAATRMRRRTHVAYSVTR